MTDIGSVFAVVTRTGEMYTLPAGECHRCHHRVIRHFKLRDAWEDVVRIIYEPSPGRAADLDAYRLKTNNETAWFDDDARCRAETSLSRLVARSIIRDARESLVCGRYIIGDGADIGSVQDCRLSVCGGKVRNIADSTVEDVNGGQVENISDSRIITVCGGHIGKVENSLVHHLKGGIIDHFAGFYLFMLSEGEIGQLDGVIQRDHGGGRIGNRGKLAAVLEDRRAYPDPTAPSRRRAAQEAKPLVGDYPPRGAR